MSHKVLVSLWVALMVATIVVIDLTLLRGSRWFWERLATNVGVVLVFGGLYFRLLAPS
jgi:membrane-bound metal-dependent hydrolase YbcI (DUF457 family)